MKLNLGCGHNKLEGYVNVDSSAYFEPDVLHDLNVAPWPWPDDSADEVLFIHSLEHMGGNPRVFMGIMLELYRVCKPGAKVIIHVPHPRHDHFISDPTHVRIINPIVLRQFDRELNQEWVKARNSNSKLALMLGVDFRIVDTIVVLDEPYATHFKNGNLVGEALDRLMTECNNIAKEYQITLEVRKTPVLTSD